METFGHIMMLELEDRGWSMSELARRTGVSHTMISRIVNDERKPSPELATKIADVLGMPPEQVFRWAGLLPARTKREELRQEILYYFDRMDRRAQEHFLDIGRTLAESSEAYGAEDDEVAGEAGISAAPASG